MELEVTHIDGKLDLVTLEAISDIICGDDASIFPVYRSSSKLTGFFQSAGINARHDGSTRKWWTLDILNGLSPKEIEAVILRLADLKEYRGDINQLKMAVSALNNVLIIDGYKIHYKYNKPVLRRAEGIEINDGMFATSEAINVRTDELEFLGKVFNDNFSINNLGIDDSLVEILSSRIREIRQCIADNIVLGGIILIGGTLEGILLNVALKNQKEFMSLKSAPKKKDGTVKDLKNWHLSGLIDGCFEFGSIGLDVMKFSHTLREFRNYVHPYRQMSEEFSPNNDTLMICWQVFKAAINDLSNRNS